MSNKTLLQELEDLERELHEPGIRSSYERVSALLHKDFKEFGESGKEYSLQTILDYLLNESANWKVWSGNYSLQHESEDMALLLYQSAHIESNGDVTAFANRSSYWVKVDNDWQMLFHQGTPTEPFSIE
jgi:hypothetical protein